jgi:hypothetical protein
VIAVDGEGNKGWIPNEKNPPYPGKNPRTSIGDPQREHEKPTWRVRRIAFEGPFGWHNATKEDWTEVRSKLSSFETMTWFEIGRAEKQHHYLSWPSLSKEARDDFDRLCRERLCREEERETIFSFRLSGKQRVIGLRVAGVFEVI